MAKQKSAAFVIGQGVGVSLLIYLLMQLLLALLAVKGILPEERLGAIQVAAALLAVLPGSFSAAKRGGLGTMIAAMLVAVFFSALLALGGLLVFDGLSMTGVSRGLLGAIAAGGLLAGLLAMRRGSGRKRRKKRRSVAGK